MVKRLAEDNQQHYSLYVKVRDRLHVLDDWTIQWAIDAYRTQLEDVTVYRAQFARWRAEALTAAQRQEIERLDGELAATHNLAVQILALLDQIRSGQAEPRPQAAAVEN